MAVRVSRLKPAFTVPDLNRRGFSLVELSIVLLVFSAILAALWNLSAAAWRNAHREQTFEAITATVTNVRQAYANGSTTGIGIIVEARTLLIPLLYKNGVIPSYLQRGVKAGTCINSGAVCMDSPMGYPKDDTLQGISYGSFEVCNWMLGKTDCIDTATAALDGTVFAVKITNIDYGACIALGTKVSGQGPSGLVDVSVNGSTIINGRTLPGTGTIPVSPHDLGALCNTTTGGSNTLAFVYRTNPPTN